MKTKSSLGDLEMPNGDLTSDSQEKADVLNNFFVSVFEEEGIENIPDFPDCPFSEPLYSFEITENLLEKAIDKVKETKSKGPHNIHPMLIKNAKRPWYLPSKSSIQNPWKKKKYRTYGKWVISLRYIKVDHVQRLKITDP